MPFAAFPILNPGSSTRSGADLRLGHRRHKEGGDAPQSVPPPSGLATTEPKLVNVVTVPPLAMLAPVPELLFAIVT